MAGPGREADKLVVFISYSREDLAFADQLDIALAGSGFITAIDRHDIPGADEWKRRLGELIRDADTVVFVLSPFSARSEMCAWEVEEAGRLGKRIIPVLCSALGDAPPPRLADLNYIHFYAEPRVPGSGFGSGLIKLIRALNEDPIWLREHTRLLGLASHWLAAARPAGRLLSGADITSAKAWLTERRQTRTEPTALHVEFIRASEDEETARLGEARRQLEERERLVREAEAALAEREAARQCEAEALSREAEASRKAADEAQRAANAQRRAARNASRGLWAALALVLVAAGLGGLAWWKQIESQANAAYAIAQQTEAEKGRAQAEVEKQRANQTRNDALLSESKHLADKARQVLEQDKDPGTAMLLALEALPDAASEDEITRTRPYWGAAEVSLAAARRLLRERSVLKGHTGAVNSVAVSPDGARFVTGSRDNTARVWDARTFTELAVLKGHTRGVSSVAVTPDGTRIVTGSDDNTARVWDAHTFAELAVLKGHSHWVRSVAVTPDGARIVTGGADHSVRVWDARTFAELAELSGHTSVVTSVAVSPDSARIITGSGWSDDDYTVRVWDMRTFGQLAVLKGHTHPVKGVAVSPDGTRIFAGAQDRVLLWDAKTFAEIGQFEGSVSSLAVSPDGARIVAGGRIVDARTLAEIGRLEGHASYITSVAVSPDGAIIITASNDSTARVWDANSSAEPAVLKGHSNWVTSFVVSADGARIVTGSNDRTARVWDGRTFAEIAVLKGHGDSVASVAVSADGARIVTGSYDKTVRVWERRSRPGASGEEWEATAILKVHTGFMVADNISVAVSADGVRIVTASFSMAQVWERRSGPGASADGWEAVAFLGGQVYVVGVAMTANGNRIVTVGADRTARVWERTVLSEKWQMVARLKGDMGWVWRVAVTSDGARIVTNSADNTVRVWNARTFTELAVLRRHPNATRAVAVMPDGARIVTGSGDNTARVWQLFPSGHALVAEAQRIAPRCLTAEQRQRYHLASAAPRWCDSRQKWPL